MHDSNLDASNGADLAARLRAIASWGDPDEVPELDRLRTSTVELAPLRATRSARRWFPLAAAAAVAVVIGVIGVVAFASDDRVEVSGASDFASTVEVSGLLRRPTADEEAQARDTDRYRPDTGPAQVSTAGHHVFLRTCRAFAHDPEVGPSPACPEGFPAGWAYVASTAGGDVHHGLLGTANELELFVLDERYFVAAASSPRGAAPTVWLIDAVSGGAGLLTWIDVPTMMSSPAQALLPGQEPRVVDAREGTLRPLAVPDEAAPGLPVTQFGSDRIWVGTAPGGDRLGLAHSDDGGETWNAVALPEQLATMGEQLPTDLVEEDKLFEIAAHGDRVAVTFSWGWNQSETTRDRLFVSQDAGRTWTSPALTEPSARSNGARLYVLADGRLVLLWSVDYYPRQLLASAGADWTVLQPAEAPRSWGEGDEIEAHRFTVNEAGVAISTSTREGECPDGICSFPNAEAARLAELDSVPETTMHSSADLNSWRTAPELDG